MQKDQYGLLKRQFPTKKGRNISAESHEQMHSLSSRNKQVRLDSESNIMIGANDSVS
jgi:hypothetical protein